MSLNTWKETLVASTVAGADFATFTTAKTVLPTNALYTFPAGYFTIGRSLRLTIVGNLSNIVTTPGTITFQCMLGAVIAFTSGAIQMSTTAHTKLPFWLDILLTCRAVGSGTSANFIGQGIALSQCFNISGADATTGHSSLLIPNVTAAAGTGWDSTLSQQLDFFAGFSVSNGANLVNIQQYTVESLN